MKQIIFTLVLMIIFSCSQAFAAEAPIFKDDANAFVTFYNDAAKQLSAPKIKMPIERLKQDTEQYGKVYAFDLKTSDVPVNFYVVQNPSDFITGILISTESENYAVGAFQTALLALGVDENDFVQPVFNENDSFATFKSSSNHSIKVVTRFEQEQYIIVFGGDNQ